MIKKEEHPELREGEIFLGNFMRSYYLSNIGWKTKRIGIHAYNHETNQPLEQDNDNFRLYPVFVKEEELKNDGVQIED